METEQKQYKCQILSVREHLEKLKSKTETKAETKPRIRQLTINKAVLRNQIVKLTPLTADNYSLGFKELSEEKRLIANASLPAIKPIRHSDSTPYKVYTYRLKPSKYLQVLSTKRGTDLLLEFSLVEIDTDLVLTEYRLASFTQKFEVAKGLFFTK